MSYFVQPEELISRGLITYANNQNLFKSDISGSIALKLEPNQSIEIEFIGKWCELHLLRHNWSGSCTIETKRKSLSVDLFSEQQDEFFKVHLDGDNEDNLPMRVKVIANPATQQQSKGNETWLIGVSFSSYQNTLSRTIRPNDDFIIIRGDYGTFLTLQKDIGISKSIIENGSWAKNDIEIWEDYVSEGNTIIDVGANIGHQTVALSKMVGDSGRIYSFEPQGLLFNILSANLALNECHNVRAEKLAISNREGSAQMYPIDYKYPNNFGALGIDPAIESDGEPVKMVKLDDYISSLTLERKVNFMKVDVQTFELYVLQGAIEFLKEHKPIIFLEVSPYWMAKRGYDYKEIYDLLFSLGYAIEHPTSKVDYPDGIRPKTDDKNEEWDILAKPAFNEK